MIAMPWSPIVPVTMRTSPGERPASGTGRSQNPTPAVLRTRPSISPRPITFVSPVTTRAPASSQAARIDA